MRASSRTSGNPDRVAEMKAIRHRVQAVQMALAGRTLLRPATYPTTSLLRLFAPSPAALLRPRPRAD